MLVIFGYKSYKKTAGIQTVYLSTTDIAEDVEGIIIKNETPIFPEVNGYLQSLVNEGQRINKGGKVAAVYKNAVDTASEYRLEEVNIAIAELEKEHNKISGNDIVKIETMMSEKAALLSDAASRADAEQVASIEDEIRRLVNIKNSGDAASKQELSTLKQEKKVLESQLGNADATIYAPISGIYSSYIDGFEGVSTEEMTVDELNEILNKQALEHINIVSGNNAACKIIDNYSWSFACLVSESSQLELGQSVELRFKNEEADYPGVVTYISDPKDGSRVAVFKSQREYSGLSDKRIVSCEVIFKSYKGFKIPLRAVHIKDGKQGVYISYKGNPLFKEITQIYKNNDYIIVAESENGIKQYDSLYISDEMLSFEE